jgi:hypothetical protein
MLPLSTVKPQRDAEYDATLAERRAGTFRSIRIKNILYIPVSRHPFPIQLQMVGIHAVTVSMDTTKDTALYKNLLVIMNTLNSQIIV